MKNTKRRMEVFVLYNHTGMERHFEKMAQKGWLIQRISTLGWVYRRIEPKKLHFCISYYPKASEFDPGPSEGQQTFYDFCAHTGWQLACTSAQMQVFYNEQENPIPIETDSALEVETIHAAAKKSFIPAQITLLVMGLLFSFIGLLGLFGNPITYLADPMKLFTSCCWTVVLLLSVMELIVYFHWHKRAEEAAENGIFLDTPDTSKIHWGCLWFILAGVFYLGINIVGSSDQLLQFIMVGMTVYMILLFALAEGIKRLGRKLKFSRKVNRTVTFVLIFVLSYAMSLTVTLSGMHLRDIGILDRDSKASASEILLPIEELTEVEGEYIAPKSESESIFLKRTNITQMPHFDEAHHSVGPNMEYTILDIKMPFLYDTCKRQMVKDLTQAARTDLPVERRNRLEPSDPTLWGAEEAYQVVNDGFEFAFSRFFLCYPDRMVEIEFSWEVTEDQMRIAGEKFR